MFIYDSGVDNKLASNTLHVNDTTIASKKNNIIPKIGSIVLFKFILLIKIQLISHLQ